MRKKTWSRISSVWCMNSAKKNSNSSKRQPSFSERPTSLSSSSTNTLEVSMKMKGFASWSEGFQTTNSSISSSPACRCIFTCCLKNGLNIALDWQGKCLWTASIPSRPGRLSKYRPIWSVTSVGCCFARSTKQSASYTCISVSRRISNSFYRSFRSAPKRLALEMSAQAALSLSTMQKTLFTWLKPQNNNEKWTSKSLIGCIGATRKWKEWDRGLWETS